MNGSLRQHGNLKPEREVLDLLIQSDFIHKPVPTANKYTLGGSTGGQDWCSQPESNYGHAAAALTWRERERPHLWLFKNVPNDYRNTVKYSGFSLHILPAS